MIYPFAIQSPVCGVIFRSCDIAVIGISVCADPIEGLVVVYMEVTRSVTCIDFFGSGNET